jgi:iron complex transport system substrate-binding protein
MLVLSACGSRPAATATSEELADTVAFKYARLIHIAQHDGYAVARVDNPWKPGKTLHTYLLVPYDSPLPPSLPKGTLVRTPLRRSIVFTSVHAALADVLGAQQQVAGVADRKYIKVPFVQQGCADGTLVDCGDGMNPLVEKIIDAGADAILLSPFENSGGYGRLEDINIPLIECAEYMESSPLARAEWLRFYGMLYGRCREADSLFSVVDSSYHTLRKLAATSTVRPSVLMDKQTGSVWYVPGGRSTIGQMLSDAYCDYPFAADSHSGSLSLPFEAVLEQAGQADVWLFRYDSKTPMTRRQLLAEQAGYSQLRPVGDGNLYGCNVSTSMFYEESPFRPDLLLQDFITILHPDLPGLPSPRYYKKIE